MLISSVDGYIVNVLKAPWMMHDELPAAEFHSSLSSLMRNKAGVCFCLPSYSTSFLGGYVAFKINMTAAQCDA